MRMHRCFVHPRAVPLISIGTYWWHDKGFCSQFDICVSPYCTLSALETHTRMHPGWKLGAAAVSMQPWRPNWHEWCYLHRDARNTCAFLCRKLFLRLTNALSYPYAVRFPLCAEFLCDSSAILVQFSIRSFHEAKLELDPSGSSAGTTFKNTL